MTCSGGDGTYRLDNGSLSASNAYVGVNDSNGNICQTGGAFAVVGDLYLGLSKVGVFDQSGGTTTIQLGGLTFCGHSPNSAIYNLNGGSLILHDMEISNSSQGTFNFGGGTLKANGAFATTVPLTLTGIGGNANVDTNDYDVTLAGQLSGPGGLNKLGGNTLTLSTANTYEGPTTVNAGTLKVANTSGSATGSGAVSISHGAALTGSGHIDGPLTVAGTVNPGDGVGTLTVNNQVTFQADSIFSVDVHGLAAGTGYDRLSVGGQVSLDGLLNLAFDSFSPSSYGGDILFLLDNTSNQATGGTFQYADNAKIGTFNGFDWYITYDANNTGILSLDGGNDVAIYTNAVPEPGTLVLLALAAVALSVSARRRSN